MSFNQFGRPQNGTSNTVPNRASFTIHRFPVMQVDSNAFSPFGSFGRSSFNQEFNNNMQSFDSNMRNFDASMQTFGNMLDSMSSVFDRPVLRPVLRPAESNGTMTASQDIFSPFASPFPSIFASLSGQPHFNGSFSSTSNGFVKKDNQYVCELEIEKDLIDCVKVKEKDRLIQITAEKTKVDENTVGGLVSRSSSTQRFNRSLQLPIDGVANTAVAKYSHGKLQIIVQCTNQEQIKSNDESVFEKYVSENLIKTYDEYDTVDVDYVYRRFTDTFETHGPLNQFPTKDSFVEYLIQNEFNVSGNTIKNAKFVNWSRINRAV